MTPTTAQRKTTAGRFYDIETAGGDFRSMVSVTNVLSVISKPALIPWAVGQATEEVSEVAASLYEELTSAPRHPLSRMAFLTALSGRLKGARRDQRVLNKAGEIGSAIHKRIERVLAQEMGAADTSPEPLVPEAQTAFNQWQAWRQSVTFRPALLEQCVYSLEHGYAGTMDVYAEVDGEMAVVDWKSGKAVYLEAYLQNAAYCHALREMGHGEPVAGYIVRLPKQAGEGFEAVRIDPAAQKEHFGMFLAALKLWRFVNQPSGNGDS